MISYDFIRFLSCIHKGTVMVTAPEIVVAGTHLSYSIFTGSISHNLAIRGWKAVLHSVKLHFSFSNSMVLHFGQEAHTPLPLWNKQVHYHHRADPTHLMKLIIWVHEDHSEPFSREVEETKQEGDGDIANSTVIIFLLCPIIATGSVTDSFNNSKFKPKMFKEMCFWWAVVCSAFSPIRAYSARESEKTQFIMEKLFLQLCPVSYFPINTQIKAWMCMYICINTHTHGGMCEKCEKAYSRETHLISVSVITIIIGTPLHRRRAWQTRIE